MQSAKGRTNLDRTSVIPIQALQSPAQLAGERALGADTARPTRRRSDKETVCRLARLKVWQLCQHWLLRARIRCPRALSMMLVEYL